MPLVHDVNLWEPKSVFDRLVVRAYSFVEDGAGPVFALVTVLVALMLGVVVVTSIAFNPLIGVFAVLSVVPAFFVAWYFWEADPTPKELAVALIVTFLFAGFGVGAALIVNSLTRSYLTSVPVIGFALFFYMVVAPVEEGVKLLAVRPHGYKGTLLHHGSGRCLRSLRGSRFRLLRKPTLPRHRPGSLRGSRVPR